MNVLKRKKIVFSAIVILLLLVFVCVNFYTIDSYAIRTYFSNSYDISARLYSGDVLEQEFTLGEGDQGVEFLVGTYVTVLDGGTVLAELYDENGSKVAEKEVSLVGTTDNQCVKFYFGNLDESLYNQKCRVRFTFADIDDQLIAVYASKISINDYEYTINGELQEHNLVMNGIKEITYVEYRDFRLCYVFGIGIFLLYMAMFKINWKELQFSKTIECVKMVVSTRWKKFLVIATLILGNSILAILLEQQLSKEGGYINPYRCLAIGIALLVVSLVLMYRKVVWERAHVFFFVISMLVGIVAVFSVPATPVCWDEQEHYARTTYMSWGATDRMSEADYMVYSNYTTSNFDNIFSKEQREAWEDKANEVEAQGGMSKYLAGVQISSISYMPASIVLYIARTLGFDFITRYYIGKLTNLFLYSLFIANAIKLLNNRGKVLVTAIGLIPTNLFMAASYGQDWWVISLIILGYAIFLHEIETSGQISTRKLTQAVLVMGIGMLVKAIYFPIMLPMMLLKKERYENSKKSRWIIVLAMLLLVASFILPMFISVNAGATAGGGDIRGGDKVNAVAQIAYILTNIPEYADTLFRFTWFYLNPDNFYKLLTQMGNQGRGPYHTICVILLSIAILLDNSEKTLFYKKEKWAVLGGWFSALLSIILIITSMFITYTPVAAHTVNGVQARYITPILFPFLFIAGENVLQISDGFKKKIHLWCLIGMALVSLYTFYSCFIIQY